MPRISYFLGISIYMYYRDHQPPHFHAMYEEYAAMVDVESGDVLAGKLPRRVAALVKEWAQQSRAQLLEDWQLAQADGDLKPIRPLE